MWVIVLFDLPTGTKMQRKEYTGFRKNLLQTGFFQMHHADPARPSLRRIMIGLAQSILHQAQLQCQPRRVSGQSRALFDYPCHRHRIQRSQFETACDPCDQRRILPFAALCALHAVFKIDRHLEQIHDIGVIGAH